MICMSLCEVVEGYTHLFVIVLEMYANAKMP